MYQRKYYARVPPSMSASWLHASSSSSSSSPFPGGIDNVPSLSLSNTYLAGAHLVEGDKGERLRQHGPRQVLLGQAQRDQHARERQLRHEGRRLDAHARTAREPGRRQVQLRVVGAEVVPVVQPADVVQVGVLEEGEAVAVWWVLVRLG